MQFFQADQVRGFTTGSVANPIPGRRPIARPLNDTHALQFNMPGDSPCPAASSSMQTVPSRCSFRRSGRSCGNPWRRKQAAAVRRNRSTRPVVRERYWIEFQPGEIRACNSCHGVNQQNQAGQSTPANPPQALSDLLGWWKLHGDEIFPDGFGG